ncbi:MAG TPA: hypothetical protein VLF89_07205 [Candidatus Saccharimonadales bacterium]|nr:hypothetical protein [Candidatus Saccharimonadales bacterium]
MFDTTATYFWQAYKFLTKNTQFYVYAFGLSLFATVLQIVVTHSFDPYGLISLLSLLGVYFLIAYFALLQLFLQKKDSEEKLTIFVVIKTFFKKTKQLMLLCALLCLAMVMGLGLFYLVLDGHFHIKLMESVFIQTKTNHGFGFYPWRAAFLTLSDLALSPFYFLSIHYFLEKNTFFSSLKKSISLSLKNISFLLPLVIFSAVSNFLYFLFVPEGNYYLVLVNTVISSFSNVLISATVFFFYKKTYTIRLTEKVLKKGKKKKINKFLLWSILIVFTLFSEASLLFAYAAVMHFIHDDRLAGVYLVLTAAIPFLLFIFRLHKSSLKKLWLFLIGSIVLCAIIFGIIMYITTIKSPLSDSQASTQTPTPTPTEVKQQFTGEDVWNAINAKRAKYGVAKLKKNEWVCKVAELRLIDNLKTGNGYFATNDGYDVAIQKVIGQYQNDESGIKKEPMPEFSFEYTFFASNLKSGVQSLIDNKDDAALFTSKEITYGCTAARKGYGIIITAFDPLYDPTTEAVTSI